MVVGVTKYDVECYSTIEFPEILLYICTTVKNEIHNIQIAPC